MNNIQKYLILLITYKLEKNIFKLKYFKILKINQLQNGNYYENKYSNYCK